MNDHDLLVTVAANVEHIKADVGEVKADFVREVAELKERVTVIERKMDRQDGFWSGAKALWGVVLSVPAGVLGWLLSGQWHSN